MVFVEYITNIADVKAILEKVKKKIVSKFIIYSIRKNIIYFFLKNIYYFKILF